MIIGSHELKGNIQTLAHPLVLLRPDPQFNKDHQVSKRKMSLSEDSSETTSLDEEKVKGYVVAGVVKRKILFNSYPKIIMR